MTKIDNGIDLSGGRSHGSTVFIIFGFILAGFFIGQFAGAIVSVILALSNGLPIEGLTEDPNALYDYLSLSGVLTTQVVYTLVFTFLVPWFYLKFFAKKSFINGLNVTHEISPKTALLAFLCTFSFMFLNSFLVEWNSSIEFPSFLSGFEEWARELEDQLAETTERFTSFNNFGEFTMGLIAIAILPGIGEEVLFRGVFQNAIHKWTKNVHVGIWVSAFIFAAIHLQFYGLVPRMMLGVVFGYIYVWSGNIWYAIIAHIVNNGIGVLAAYLMGSTIDDSEMVPPYVHIVALLAFVGLMFYFRKSQSEKVHQLE